MLPPLALLLGLAAIASCTVRGPRAPIATPAAGISIAIYGGDARSYGVVDDRRWVEIAGGDLVLDRIEPDAALSSLVIETLGGPPLRLGTCTRERIDPSQAGLDAFAQVREAQRRTITAVDTLHEPRSPDGYRREHQVEPAIRARPGVLSSLVRCEVKARSGRHLVRVLYVTEALRYRTQHDVTMTIATRARVATRFAFVTPTWRMPAEVALFDGLPGGAAPPRLLARGPVMLDGGTGVFAAPVRDLAAELRRVYDGAIAQSPERRVLHDERRTTRQAVWVWLEIPETDAAALPPGPVRAHVAVAGEPVRDVEVPAAGRERAGEVTRWPLWIDETLRGRRRHIVDEQGTLLSTTISIAVSNLGAAPRELWVEERLRPAKRTRIANPWPAAPTVTKTLTRSKVMLAPGTTTRLGFTVRYER